MSTFPPPTFRARREPARPASLARFCGLSALAGRLQRGPLRTRQQRTAVAGGAASMVAAVAAVALLVPATRPALSAIIHAPGTLIEQLGGGGASDAGLKGYPRLYSSRLGVDVKIEPGDGKTPPVQPVAFEYPGTAALGQPGNTYLYSHDRPGMFLGLHRAAVGDVLVVELSKTERLYYQVTEIHGDVAWNDFEWLQPSGDNRITLQTCNYSGDYDPRFIVVTRQIPASQGRSIAGI